MAKHDLGNVQGPAGPIGPMGPMGPAGPSGLTDINTDREGLLGSIVLGEKILIQWGYYAITKGDAWERININRPYKNGNYNIQISPYWREDYHDIYLGVIETDGFNVACVGQPKNGMGVYWFTIGEI